MTSEIPAVGPAGPNEHVGHLYRDLDEQRAVVLGFFRAGLAKDECCILVAPDSERKPEDWYCDLLKMGVNVPEKRETGQLLVVTAEEWKQPSDFRALAEVRNAWHLLEDRFRYFRGVRIVLQTGWSVKPAIPPSQLCHWEAALDMLLEDLQVQAICQYEIARHTPPALHSVLRTHPIIALDGRCHINPYYEAPSILQHEPLLDSSADRQLVNDMLDQLRASGGYSPD